ncbi:MAG TPA: FtsX-like permease family protein, partial [Alphaproteobacteria bacterium]|nr:FtsX-like permease family protein [Alphaproteobacteria bacterium]
ESLLLGLLGGVAGFLLAWSGFSALVALAPRVPTFQPHALRVDTQVFIFSLLASLFVSILFGLIPAMRASRKGSNELLRAGRGVQGGLRDRAARSLLVMGEVALAVALMIASGLLVRSLRNLQTDPLGYSPDHLLMTGFCCLDMAHYPGQRDINAFYRQLSGRLQSLPGVESIASTTVLPLRSFDGGGTPILIQGRPVPAPGNEELSDFRVVGNAYFSTLKIPLLRGRDFTEQDDDEHAQVALINDAFRRRYFQDKEPLGQQVQIVNHVPFGRWFNVIGVVTDSRDRGLGKEIRPTIYLTVQQNDVRGTMMMVRTKADPMTMAANVRRTMLSVKSDLFIGRTSTMDDMLADSLSPQRFSVVLLSLFTGIAVGLALVGVYGVISYSVAQRTHEIGLRMALGAQPRDMLRLVIGQGLRLVLTGTAVGLAAAMAATQLMTNLLFGVSARDPLTAVLVCTAAVAVALMACYVPARRAMRVDPMIALRYE